MRSVTDAIESQQFRVLSGREKGQTDNTQFLRTGAMGDHKNWMDSALISHVKSLADHAIHKELTNRKNS